MKYNVNVFRGLKVYQKLLTIPPVELPSNETQQKIQQNIHRQRLIRSLLVLVSRNVTPRDPFPSSLGMVSFSKHLKS